MFEKGHKHSEEAKIKMSQSHKGKILSEEHKRKIGQSLSIVLKGKHNSPKTEFKKGHKPFLQIGKDSPSWKGGKYQSKNGYIFIKDYVHPFRDRCNYVSEHRLVIEKHLGRYLTKKETVHHIGEENDNRIHMLMAFTSQSAHIRFHKNPNNVKPEEIIFDGRNYKDFQPTMNSLSNHATSLLALRKMI